MLRLILLTLFMLGSFCACSSSDKIDPEQIWPPIVDTVNGNMQIKVRKASQKDLSLALSAGRPKVLTDRQYDLRLYEIPISCETDKKTLEICAHRYVLGVRLKSSSPIQNQETDFEVYDLGTVGEILSARTLENNKKEAATLAIVVSNHPKRRLQRIKELLAKTQELRLHLLSTILTLD